MILLALAAYVSFAHNDTLHSLSLIHIFGTQLTHRFDGGVQLELDLLGFQESLDGIGDFSVLAFEDPVGDVYKRQRLLCTAHGCLCGRKTAPLDFPVHCRAFEPADCIYTDRSAVADEAKEATRGACAG